MTFDVSKCRRDENGHLIARTRDKREVRLCCTNAPGLYPLIGWWVASPMVLLKWTADGQEIHNKPPSPNDLTNEPGTVTVTVFKYGPEREGLAMWLGERAVSEFRSQWPQTPLLARKVITITEGEGL